MRRRPVVVVQSRRRGAGLIGTMARTAVIAGTATAVSRGVSGAMVAGAQQRAQMEDYQAQQAAAWQQDQIDAAVQQQLATQQAAMQPQADASPARAAPAAAASDDLMAQLQQLGQMKQAGLLTEEEFAAAKAKLLAS